MMAFQAPGVEVIGLTTIFGNCTTAYATRNALILASTINPSCRLCIMKLLAALHLWSLLKKLC
jgi:inosine-uridine nucleoside N-ribohydrolase